MDPQVMAFVGGLLEVGMLREDLLELVMVVDEEVVVKEELVVD